MHMKSKIFFFLYFFVFLRVCLFYLCNVILRRVPVLHLFLASKDDGSGVAGRLSDVRWLANAASCSCPTSDVKSPMEAKVQ